jgi:hypothetical protein
MSIQKQAIAASHGFLFPVYRSNPADLLHLQSKAHRLEDGVRFHDSVFDAPRAAVFGSDP